MVNMPNISGLVDKVKDAVSGNSDKVRTGIDKVGEVVNKTTGGKFKEQIDKGSDMLGDALGAPKNDGPAEESQDKPA